MKLKHTLVEICVCNLNGEVKFSQRVLLIDEREHESEALLCRGMFHGVRIDTIDINQYVVVVTNLQYAQKQGLAAVDKMRLHWCIPSI